MVSGIIIIGWGIFIIALLEAGKEVLSSSEKSFGTKVIDLLGVLLAIISITIAALVLLGVQAGEIH